MKATEIRRGQEYAVVTYGRPQPGRTVYRASVIYDNGAGGRHRRWIVNLTGCWKSSRGELLEITAGEYTLKALQFVDHWEEWHARAKAQHAALQDEAQRRKQERAERLRKQQRFLDLVGLGEVQTQGYGHVLCLNDEQIAKALAYLEKTAGAVKAAEALDLLDL